MVATSDGELIPAEIRFGVGHWKGKTIYRCLGCSYETFEEVQITDHCRKRKHSGGGDGRTHTEYLKSVAGSLRGLKITLGMICWNTVQPSVDALCALEIEKSRLLGAGAADVNIIVVDNGSTDGTYDELRKYAKGPTALSGMGSNTGISAARNYIIDVATSKGFHLGCSDYILFQDGDLEVVPCSVVAMVRFIHERPTVGCIGAASSQCSRVRRECSEYQYDIDPNRTSHSIKCAWTQYGVFRSVMFQRGVRFDESGPFAGPGWGYEDNDLYFQMYKAGYENLSFKGMTYLHRNLRSSLVNLAKDGHDPKDLFEKRKKYLLDKWTGHVPDAMVRDIAGQHYPG